ncbi:MAG TPA: LLM class flavin-dependent oxidoreductase [Lysinibacillus sp.]|jgi:luciferase family oxidoreductase group 1|uniref:LLM class flavin-dependent oxidoreductase n=1 Tax=Lysinibacillus fusiformis TaxID=28031 RepID=A0A2I0V095_9BACI|nr:MULTISPECIES: LLM class flavin-dependent oxidoreductase [Lysinibacillus]HBT72462.1 LLM class flavin-dependent oxidoreductase [Lysinibacillus sp.]KUF32025.1 luciferase [Lysinibacillus sp. F5]MEE3806235.1 LLM class flavin-dependent oxidoreductase [Lysinibacillus fusiformis]PKU51744.1 LLM class flavin-dependent oxidoreductase [Lysinibacillus fusiformis]WCH46025.1 LLM class flavin-dependent oxidoreductase [Lysinibacillus sp. OF-1]
MRLSMLDQMPIPKGHSAEEAFQRTEQLALLGEELGYHRMWLAEHHNSQSLASSAPEVTAAFLAAKTKRLRIGTGGVMMMHYSPYKLAEVFKTLSGLAPNRIDFGVGRAPGGDHAAIYALAEGRRQRFTEQYDKLEIVLKLMNNQKTGEHVYDQVIAAPAHISLPEAWLLGSSGQSAMQAGQLGVGYSYAQFFTGNMSKDIFDAYKSYFTPSYYMEKPQIIVTYAATVAPTLEEAEYLAKPIDISRLQLMKGQIIQTMSPEEAKDYPLSEMDKMTIDNNRKANLVGTPKDIAAFLIAEQEKYGFDEVMLNCNQYELESRLNTYKFLAKELI